jgi:hypothetical protein
MRCASWTGATRSSPATAAQAAYGVGTVRAQQRHALTPADPQTVLTALRVLRAEVAAEQGADAAPGAGITHSLAYLDKRLAQIQYATFAAQGDPRGSGSVESANKLVVQARLKGAGMRWARVPVNPLVALRTVACSDRWDEAWPQITMQWRAQGGTRRRERATARRQAAAVAAPQGEPVPPPATAAPSPASAPHPTAPVAPPPGRRGPRRPAADHPWRPSPLGRPRCA